MVHTVRNEELSPTELLKRAKEGDEEAMELFIQQNTGLVYSVAAKFYHRGVDPEEIRQLGMFGLFQAVRKFDFQYEVKFSTYAVPMIMGEIKRFLRDDGAVKVSRSLKELAAKAKYMIDRMEKQTGKQPTIHQLSQELHVETEDLICALNASETPESIDGYVGDEESGMRLIDKVEDKTVETEDAIVDKITLQDMIGCLEKRERQIITMRYFQGKTQQVIADILGISQVQVSRIEKRVLCALRAKLEEDKS